MRLNIDCIRDIMFEVEKLQFNQVLEFNELVEKLPTYTPDELAYTTIKLNEAGLLLATISNTYAGTLVSTLDDLTYSGHLFIADVRSDNIWGKTKSILAKLGSESIPIVSRVASTLMAEFISKQINL